MRIYIAGKITGNPEAGEAFENAETRLRMEGPNEIINPYKIGEKLPQMKHEDYMHVSFALIDIAETVYFLENWKDSQGACMEYGYALAEGKKIIFEE